MELFSKEFLEKKTKVFFNSKEPECLQCGLYRYANTPKMKHSGKGEKRILILSESPSKQEDSYGKVLSGSDGNFLKNSLQDLGIDLEKDCWKINTVACRTHTKDTDRKPSKEEIYFCKPEIERAIQYLKPTFIWTFGTSALECLLGDDFKNKTMERWRGLCIPDKKYQTYILPMFHPSLALSKSREENFKSFFQHDLRHAVECLDRRPFDILDSTTSDIDILTDCDDICETLDKVIKVSPEYFFFDYETTGLKPFYPGHKIVSMSFATELYRAYSFPYDHTSIFTEKEKEAIKTRWTKILLNPDIKKVAQNIQFEDLWSSVLLKTKPANWHWCTQLTARCTDNRRAGSGLKYQVYREFGIRPYDKHIEGYLKGKPFNKVEQIPLKELLEYGAYDSLYGFQLFQKQVQNFPKSCDEGRKILAESSINFSGMTETGMRVDEEYFHSSIEKIEKRIKKLEENMLQSKEVKAFEKKFKRTPLLTSNQDLGLLFYEVMNFPKVYTDKTEKNYSVDKEALDKIDSFFVSDLLDCRKLEKIAGTYLRGFLDVTVNGKIHPSFSHSKAISLRSESSDPNFQNIPARDEEAKQIIRKGLKALDGYKFLEGDYSGIEVYTGCFYHKDKNMIKYLQDSTTDMHRDTASDIWILNKNEITKQIRHSGKNGWVFPQFYGSYFKSCAKNLWNNFMDTHEMCLMDGTPMRDHLASKGIKTYKAFEDHCKAVEEIFWGDRFFEYDQWRKDINAFYRKHGYIETFFGFKFSGYMQEKDVTNLGIQGTAHHILMWALNRMQEEIEKNKWKSRFAGNVHDSGCMHVWPEEEDDVVNTLLDITTIEVVETHPWIFLPLKFDIEITEINGSWVDKKPIIFED